LKRKISAKGDLYNLWSAFGVPIRLGLGMATLSLPLSFPGFLFDGRPDHFCHQIGLVNAKRAGSGGENVQPV
jgi:hypothetical protein